MTYANQNSGNPRLYFRDVALTNTTSPVTSIDLYYLSGQASSHNDIVAVSGAKTAGGAISPIDVTGFDCDFVVEASAPKRGQIFATSYRITFNHVRDDSSATELQFAEMELRGVQGVAAGSPRLTFSFSSGSLSVSSGANGTLQATTALQGTNTVWVTEQPVTAGTAVQIPVNSSIPAKFYRVKGQ